MVSKVCPNCGADLSESRKLVRTSAKELVEALEPTQAMREFVASVLPDGDWTGVDKFMLAELANFKDRMRANGYRTNAGPVKDAAAAFRTHMRNAVKFSARNSGSVRPAARTRVQEKKEL